MDASLPASWLRIDAPYPRYHAVKLPFSRFTWLAFADIPGTYNLFDLYRDLHRSFPEGFVIRGCQPDIASLLLSKRHDTFRTGIEAVLRLSDSLHFDGKKVRAALKRGWRHGVVEEVPLESVHSGQFNALLAASPHAGKPQLRHVFRSHPSQASRCFVFKSFAGSWLGCVTLSRQGAKAYHTELMLRSRNAPGDIMECLITEIGAILRREGAEELSLGEVPFMRHEDDHHPLSLLEQLFFSAAPLFRPAYDYERLYFFKNKFRPIWRTMRLCAGPGVQFSPSFLVELAYAMGFVELLVFGR
jgi:phosphatidylglycerol lysyltransferase